MKKTVLLLAILFCASPAIAQRTLVSGTVKDVNNLPYSGASLTVTLVTPIGTSGAYLNGAQVQGVVGPVLLDSTGSFLVNLADNTLIQCANAQGQLIACAPQTKWSFAFTISPGVSPPTGTGPQTCPAGGAGTALTITGASQSVSASFSACPALSMTTGGGSAPGIFTDTPGNDVFTFSLNGCNPDNVFGNVIVPNGHHPTDALAGCITVPASGVSNGFSSGVAGYAINLNGTNNCQIGANCEAVGVSGMAWSQATNALVWGGNFVAQSTAGKQTRVTGLEVDAITNNSGDAGAGVFISAFGNAAPTTTLFPGVELTAAGSSKFYQGFYCDVAVTTSGMCIQARNLANTVNSPSQTLEMEATNFNGTTVPAAFQETPIGTTAYTALTGLGGDLVPQGFGTAISTKTAGYTLTNVDGTIICNGTLTLVLPVVNIAPGQTYHIEESAAASTCTVSSSVNINGATSFTLTTQFAVAAVQWDGTQWWRIQ